MSWVRIDDHFYDHPKWATAPGDSIALWLAAMAWCNRNESFDGFIPAKKLPGLVNIFSAKKSAQDLVERRAFVVQGDGYLIHEYAEYQQNEKVKAIREKRSQAGRKGASVRWGTTGAVMANAIANPMANAIANEKQTVWQTDGNENAPPPTTHLIQVSDNSTPVDTQSHGEEFDLRINATADAYAHIALQQAANLANPEAYTRKARATALAHPDIRRYLTRWPTAPAGAVAAWLHGEKHSMGYYPEAHNIATVHPLHPDTDDLAPASQTMPEHLAPAITDDQETT